MVVALDNDTTMIVSVIQNIPMSLAIVVGEVAFGLTIMVIGYILFGN